MLPSTPDHQVGQTGKTVHPKVYVALGISGSIQHKAGMSESECIIAVNKNDTAPILEIADYGICGDLFKVTPMLIEAFKAAKASSIFIKEGHRLRCPFFDLQAVGVRNCSFASQVSNFHTCGREVFF